MVCVEGRQCVQEGWQGEEPYFESDKSNIHCTAVNQINNHMYVHNMNMILT